MTKQEKTTTHDAVKLRRQAEKARLAEEWWNNPIRQELFDILYKRIETGWKDSSSEDRQARDNAYYLYRSAKALEGILKSILVSGNNAKVLLHLEEIKGGSS